MVLHLTETLKRHLLQMVGKAEKGQSHMALLLSAHHQGKGLGKMILKEIEGWIEGSVPLPGSISLVANGQAKELYAKHGLGETAFTGAW